MNILVLNYEYPPVGGGGGFVSKEMAEILSKNNKVTVITMAFKDISKYESNGNLEVYRVPALRKRIDACKPQEQLTYIISGIRFLKKHLKCNKYDVCHVHFIIPTGVMALWLKKKYKIPYIITAHGSDVPGHNTSKYTLLYKILKKPWIEIVKNASFVVAPSIYLKKLMIKTYSSYQYSVIPNGLCTECYKSLKKKKYILTMSRLQEMKGIQDVIKAMALIKDTKGWNLLIAGDGPYRDDLEKLVRNLDLTNKVRFLGWIENKTPKHIKLLAEAGIYVSASYFENCPISVLEAGCSGAKLILSDIEAHRQLVGNDADYFQPGNEHALAEKIENILNNNKGKTLSNPSKKDWSYVIKKYEGLLSEARSKK